MLRFSRVGKRNLDPSWSTSLRRSLYPTLPLPYRRNYSDTSVAPMTKIEKIVLDSIKATGPLSFTTYTQLCLSHPTDGYYMNPGNPVFGTQGDFITSPEISQVFGELVAIWLLSRWMNAGRPPRIRLIELGPGRGTLMHDIIRVVTQIAPPGSLKNVHLIETSPAMRLMQTNKLLAASKEGGYDLCWHESVEDIPQAEDTYTMLVAHEFFDALPFHVLQKTDEGWHEVLISSTSQPTSPETELLPKLRLQRGLSRSPTAASQFLPLSSPRFGSLPVGSTIEVSPASFKIARKIGELLSSSSTPGSALIIDYGDDHVFGDSFRAFKDHKVTDVFHRPGECDLTVNVDFAYLKEAFAGLATPHGPMPQGTFLTQMGLPIRVEALFTAAETEERKRAIEDAAIRLIDPTGMGKEYKVLGITGGLFPQVRDGAVEEVWPFVEEARSMDFDHAAQ